MNLKTALVTMLVAGAATFAPAQEAAAVALKVPGLVVIHGELTIDATVTKVDAKTRIVTLKTKAGETEEVVAGPSVKNFDQIKVGDKVHAKATQSLTLELIKGGGKGKPSRVDGSGAAKAEKGAKPSGAVAENVTITANVTAVDRTAKTITVQGPVRTLTLDVSDPEQLKLIEVGDAIKGTYKVAVAVALAAAK